MSSKILLFIVLLVALPAAGWFWLVLPSGGEMQRVQGEVNKKKQELARADAQIGDPKARAETAKLKDALEKFKQRLPDANELSKVIDEICAVARNHNLTVKTFQNVATVAKEGYGEQTIRWTIIGTFKPNLSDFFADLEGLPRITRITEMKIEGDEKYTGSVTATFIVTTYFTPNGSGKLAVAQ